MRSLLVLASLVLALHAPAAAAVKAPRTPPPDSTARAALNASPRHGEMIDVPLPDSGHVLRSWIVCPERRDKAGVVIVIHEIFGLSDWVRGVCDQLAADGFIAVAPDLLSGYGPGGGGTESFPSRDSVVQAIRLLTPEVTGARLAAVRAYATHAIPAANGRTATLGFCWGGGVSFGQAAVDPPHAACVVYYGTSPDSATLARVQAPVLGLYGGGDARVTSTIEPARAVLKARKRTYEAHVYAGAGHGFLRAQGDRGGANAKATREAWPETVAFLHKYLDR